MATSDKAINQARAILNKLDRQIDRARTQRLGHEDTPDSPPTPNATPNRRAAVPGRTAGVTPNERAHAASTAEQAELAARGRSGFGIAKPKPRDPDPRVNAAWRSGDASRSEKAPVDPASQKLPEDK